MSKTIEIPDEGYKLVVIAGYFNEKPIWRQVGTLRIGKGNKLSISVDRTFSPAGVQCEPNQATVLLSAVPYSKEELKKKQSYRDNKTPPQVQKFIPKEIYKSNFQDMDDDIPF